MRAASTLSHALRSNPEDSGLLNNLAFAQAELGRLDQADDILDRAEKVAPSTPSRIALQATRGLVLFRRGYPDIGREHYVAAIGLARQCGQRRYETLARLFLAREEVRSNPDSASEAVGGALELAAKSKEADVLELARRLRHPSSELTRPLP
jgi:tetratricopeptide (TPR) repeat protein